MSKKDSIQYNVEDEQEIKTAKKRKKKRNPSIIIYLLAVIVMSVTVYYAYQTYQLVSSYTFLPEKYITYLRYGIYGFCGFFGLIAILPFTNNLNKILQIIICGAMCVGMFYFNQYLPTIKGQLERTFIAIPEEGELMINAYVFENKEYESITDLQGKVIGIQTQLDTEYQDYALKVINREFDGEEVTTKEYEDIYSLVDAFYAGEIDAMLLNETYAIIISENEDFKNFEDETEILYTCIQKRTLEFDATAVGDITTEPFVVLVGGNDEWVANMDNLTYLGRTDVQMLVIVNPTTKQILTITIPRDTYVPLFGNSYCMDKLTHASIYGLQAWVNTVKSFMNIDINYYVRVNFASVANIVDAIGGIEVDNPYYFTSWACLTYDSAKKKTVQNFEKFEVGTIHLDGKRALGFARERYYVKADGTQIGDQGRNIHQAMVLKAIVKKVTTVDSITHIESLLQAIQGTFMTNLTTDKIYALVQMQLDDMASWDMVQYNITGTGSWETSYAMGQNSGITYSVLIANQSTVKKAKDYINQIMNNQIVVIE